MLAAGAIQELATVKRIDEQRLGSLRKAEHEVGRQVHPVERQVQALGDRSVQDREADRDSLPAIDDLI